jgi:hypothetical protein
MRGRGVMLTTHPHLVPRLRMSRRYTSSPPRRLHGVERDTFTFYRGRTLLQFYIVTPRKVTGDKSTWCTIWCVRVLPVSGLYIYKSSIFFFLSKTSCVASYVWKSKCKGYVLRYKILDIKLTVFARVQAVLFWQEFTLQNWGATYTRNWKKEPISSEKKPLLYRRLSPWRRYCYAVKPPVETLSSRYHRLSIDSQKSEYRYITDKLP